MTTVGIIANPAAGKDIRRLVARGRFVTNEEKVNVLRRLLAGIDATEVERIVMMPDRAMIGRAALDGMSLNLRVEFLDMAILSDDRDSSTAAEMMAQLGVGVLVTLGGDGTNRAVAKGSGDVPLIAVSTGTNNVFPSMVEGTLAGLAAGVVADGRVDAETVSHKTRRLEVYFDGSLEDIALVDVSVSTESFVGARAIWDMTTVHEIFVTKVQPASIGLSAIAAQLHPLGANGDPGVHLRLGKGGKTVVAAIAPGIVCPVQVRDWQPLQVNDSVEIELRPCTVALDGERTLRLPANQNAEVRLSAKGPPVISVEDALREAASKGIFVQAWDTSQGTT